jgi:elongation factor G
MSGFPLVGVTVTVIALGFRAEDTTEVACKVAGSTAFRQACMKAAPVLLEPMMKIEIVTPEDFTGPVINDLNGRRGKILGMLPRGVQQAVDGEVPLSEMFGYATALRSLSQGRAVYTMQFDRFEKTSTAVQDAVLRRIGR